ncbi:hypothetical protein AAHD62_24235 [Enterobacter hormaechei]
MKKIILLMGILLAGSAAAQTVTMNCGDYRVDFIAGAMSKVNGETVTSQKITKLGNSGSRIQMTLMPARDGNMYGYEYVHPENSQRRWLNVELIRTNMQQYRIIGAFDCNKVAG